MIATSELEETYIKTDTSGAARVSSDMKNGEVLTTVVEHGLGTPEDPLTANDVDGKFRLLSFATLDDLPNFDFSAKTEVGLNA